MEVVIATSRRRDTTRRELGSYYTPRFIVQDMLNCSLGPMLQRRLPCDGEPLRILDLACGDGAFLRAAFDLLLTWYESSTVTPQGNLARGTLLPPRCSPTSSATRLKIIRRHLFGVDVDSAAVTSLRSHLFERVAPEPSAADETRRIIRANIRWANSLTGSDFRSSNRLFDDLSDVADETAEPLNFRDTFPQVLRNGGFDVVIGNPPYRRELNAKPLFDRIAATPLGQKWREPRMDLWYYFLHRGLDLLRSGGLLSFIVHSYWTGSQGARKLIDRLQAETTLEEIVMLGKAPIFPDVAGQHLIFRLRTGHQPQNCQVLDLSAEPAKVEELLPRYDLLSRSSRATSLATSSVEGTNTTIFEIPQRDLFRHGRLTLSRPDPLIGRLDCSQMLGDFYEVRQGMAENPPCITKRHQREFGIDLRVGEGVFVLTAEEVKRLAFSDFERSFLRPDYKTSALGRYALPDGPTHSVLYLTRTSAPTLAGCPHIRQHLQRFRSILERRRETRRGRIEWWQLHWPRVERLFTRPRILSIQMGRVPQFVWAVRPTFVGFSVNLLLSTTRSPFDLPTLTGILNSALARRWFEHSAKRRGVNLEINGRVLREFPLPQDNQNLANKIARLVEERQTLQLDTKNDDGLPRQTRLEQRIDRLVCRLYQVSAAECLTPKT